MKNLPHSCRGRVYSSTLGAGCVYQRERQRHYGGWGVLNAVVRSSYFATVEAPDWCYATAVCKSNKYAALLWYCGGQ